MSLLLAAPLFVPFTAALLALALHRQLVVQKVLGVAGATLTFAATLAVFARVEAHGTLVLHVGGWPAPHGIVLVADLFSAIMVAISGLMGFAVAVYALQDIDAPRVRCYFFPLYLLLLMGINGAFLTGDLFNLFVWFEVMLIASFVLMALGGEQQQVEGALKYVFINLVASVCFLAGVGVLYGKLGTLNMADVADLLAQSEDAVLVNSSAALLLSAFAIKAALFPFFFWLPDSYHTPPTAVSAIFAGMLTKVGVYALIRAVTLLFATSFGSLQDLFLFLAGATMATGVLGAAAHFEMKRILSFHIISQIGYMVMGLALFTPAALAGAIFYLIHHIIVKTNLFLVSGLVGKLQGSTQLDRVGGLYRSSPWLAALFFIPAYSLGGIPPLSGFWAKFMVIKAGLDAQAWLLVTVALLVGVLTLFSMTKIWAEAFWRPSPRESVWQPLRWQQWLPLAGPSVLLAGLTVAIGLYGGPFFELAQRAATELFTPEAYVAAVLGP
ncbi:MAG: Na+/H+ antiporter subunit D [Candidatus Krumholzibacteriia bacterium]